MGSWLLGIVGESAGKELTGSVDVVSGISTGAVVVVSIGCAIGVGWDGIVLVVVLESSTGGSVAGGEVVGGSVTGGSVVGGSVAGELVTGGSVAGEDVGGNTVVGGTVGASGLFGATAPKD